MGPSAHGRAGYGRLLLGLVVAATVSGCPKRDSASRPSPATVSTVTSATTASGGPTTSVTTTTTAVGGHCRTTGLKAALGPRDAGAGSVYLQIVFENASPAPCTIAGYPGVSFLDAHGTQIGTPLDRVAMSHTTVTLPSGGKAYALVQVVNPDVPPCPPGVVATIRLFPPDERAPLLVPVTDLRVCAAQRSPGSVKPVSDHPEG